VNGELPDVTVDGVSIRRVHADVRHCPDDAAVTIRALAKTAEDVGAGLDEVVYRETVALSAWALLDSDQRRARIREVLMRAIGEWVDVHLTVDGEPADGGAARGRLEDARRRMAEAAEARACRHCTKPRADHYEPGDGRFMCLVFNSTNGDEYEPKEPAA
jgi:hypothetical protein